MREDFWKFTSCFGPIFPCSIWGRSGRERRYYRFLLTKLAKMVSFVFFAGLEHV
jgi:hypothetical protein